MTDLELYKHLSQILLKKITEKSEDSDEDKNIALLSRLNHEVCKRIKDIKLSQKNLHGKTMLHFTAPEE